ncbi:hypothetical protein [Streptomyces sp. NBC_00096]|uniref:hypothetical protein n=1 Tax=Streptomyces sp. NBC_00096 TaxID=2975650 RepID=UPI003251BAB8
MGPAGLTVRTHGEADPARQALANHSRVLLPRITEAYEAQDVDLFRELTAE